MKKRIGRTESLFATFDENKKRTTQKVTLCALSKSDLVKKILSKPLKKKRQGYNFAFKPKTPRRVRARGGETEATRMQPLFPNFMGMKFTRN